MTRELKIALLIGFCLVLVVSVLIADHLSAARNAKLAEATGEKTPLVHDPLKMVGDITPGTGIQPGPLAISPVEPATVGNTAADPGANFATPQPADAYAMVGAVAIKDPITTPAVTPGMAQPQAAPNDAPFTFVQGQGQPGVEPSPSTPDLTLAQVAAREGARLINGRLELPGAAKIDSLPSTPAPRTLEPVAPPESFTTYTVKSGDNLYKIAKKVLGNGDRWRVLADANKDKISKNGNLQIGTVLKIPAAKPTLAQATSPDRAKDTRATTPGRTAKADTTAIADSRQADPKNVKGKAEPKPASAAASTYTVKSGDSLGMISKATLGTSKRVDEILELNKGKLTDEDSIQVGMVLKLPAK